MNNKPQTIIILIIALIFSINTLGQQQKVITNFDQAKEIAQQENKPIFMLFTGSDWCPPCIYFENKVLHNETFETYLNENFVFLMLDFPTNKQQTKAQIDHNYNLLRNTNYNSRKVFPSMVLVNHTGKKMYEIDYLGEPANELQETLEFLLQHHQKEQ